jgi:hypothetical protein
MVEQKEQFVGKKVKKKDFKTGWMGELGTKATGRDF